MRVRAAVKKLCEACRVVKRRGKVFIVCKENKKVFGIELCPSVREIRRRLGCKPHLARATSCPFHPPHTSQHKQRQGIHTDAMAIAEKQQSLPTPSRSFVDSGASVGVKLWQGIL
ncbi:PRPL36 [Auxenochlorella protothecoides x Auxenochlorella symbiontica]|uniref:Ribosomal protein n=1 Tax=Auxenochlorella protothecoides TaxID=3075 RepID=A0A1D2A8L1_AUXPR